MSFDENQREEPDEGPYGTCDWGNCDEPATRWRRSWHFGWLLVCDACFRKPRPEVDEWCT